ncbi:murein biosynthesis integral membrane protein MurJ [Actinomycetospora corticicola]|uniref:Putative peptidoglycan lipid II flippase n=1 Tax=Actinomycetospora corticicola TaxID=663602 RepID=A0A7Y9J7R3_9PSEU|nr:murein biosynthesis integral membrane protein MurJ [Actinomycetospora corticicola]NYD38301.1 putative peptidoglycan lipid II flippase [Actinomycetospora corticicola]
MTGRSGRGTDTPATHDADGHVVVPPPPAPVDDPPPARRPPGPPVPPVPPGPAAHPGQPVPPGHAGQPVPPGQAAHSGQPGRPGPAGPPRTPGDDPEAHTRPTATPGPAGAPGGIPSGGPPPLAPVGPDAGHPSPPPPGRPAGPPAPPPGRPAGPPPVPPPAAPSGRPGPAASRTPPAPPRAAVPPLGAAPLPGPTPSPGPLPSGPAAAGPPRPVDPGATRPISARDAVTVPARALPADAPPRTGRPPARVEEATTRLGALPGVDAATVRAAPLASWTVGDSPDETVLLPRPPLEQDAPAVPAPRSPSDDRDDSSLVKASGGMAIATLVSRLTGFLRTLALAATLGLGLVGSSFNIANTLPNIIFELLLGGVLTSVVIPVLVRAAKEDGDDGDAFAQKLLSGAAVALFVATTAATIAAPLLVRPYISDPQDVELAARFAYLLLPQIFFYGMGALFGAILNARAVFGPAAWAPVLNNVVCLIALAIYWVLPSPPGDGISTTQLLVVGVGSTLGIVLQAAVMLPAMRRTGFHWRWRFGWDQRLSAFGGLAAWVVGYVVVSQIGLTVITRVAFAADAGGPAIYSYAWLLIQVPYGVLGVSLLTALMPRMSAAAANGRIDQVVADLSLGSRLSTVTLLPISAILTVFGTPLGVAMFSLGKSGAASAGTLGTALACSAFGLLPMAVTMLQLRVFYAMADARTPTLIMVMMTAVKVPLAYLCPVLLAPDQVVLGLAAVNAFGFVVGLVVGDVWLRIRLGRLDTRRVLRTMMLTGLASVMAVLVAVMLVTLLERVLPGGGTVAHAWLTVTVGGVVSLLVVVVAMRLLRVPELDPVVSRLRRLVGR